jgi:hypothetical protein
MATFSIESNGRLEKTALYFNGEQIGGVKELFLNIDEEGTFDAIIQYEGTDKKIHSKHIFNDYLEFLQVVEPSFTEEEAQSLRALTIDSEGEIEDTLVLLDDEQEEGIVSLFVHIKAANNPKGLKAFFNKNNIPEHPEFKAEIVFRYDDGSLETEEIF